ncbi:gliding motility lipoprotein GldH [Porphyromonas levii]|uniref:Gliding motility lipoprotein GldH n=1 Tax=Porphyromonas levii TaxID=28114 RepID=A0A4Y8WN09_9PORP|nr:gliding motility lipoprotein GldH [Porphyromonas levii]MBR8703616.1 hypothetical protein [Porphyromonas levii]MBR8712652.1 hypothetical protein [Porphyromonas levii]MBR8714734.1 hypothetical protein [Porphyromonas levii]MBR8727218.1 hypothetical protein [Porphyromonas levii]MBR8729511.1 hypothetical protein [Porphyromonas levii]
MEGRRTLLLTVLLLLFGCIGCKRVGGTYQYFEMIEDRGWSSDKEVFFSSAELKPNALYNVSLVLRLDRDITYRTIPIGITFETPNRELKTRVVQVPINRVKGDKSGYNIFEQKTVLEQGVQFPSQGVYSYSLRHLSTDSIIPGVVEVGLLIEPASR